MGGGGHGGLDIADAEEAEPAEGRWEEGAVDGDLDEVVGYVEHHGLISEDGVRHVRRPFHCWSKIEMALHII